MNLQRRALFRPLKAAENMLRPPWSGDADTFSERCSRCNACIDRCEEKILIFGDGGFPEINFERGECTFCGACEQACDSNVISRQQSDNFDNYQPRISQDCLNSRGIVCQLCRDSCEAEAILVSYSSTPQLPQINLADCSRCGACVAACPERAIQVVNLSCLHQSSASQAREPV